jgi:hypothetical protein
MSQTNDLSGSVTQERCVLQKRNKMRGRMHIVIKILTSIPNGRGSDRAPSF